MKLQSALAIGLAAGSTTLTNLAYLREHDAAAELPALSMRRPLQSLRLLIQDRSWMLGFGMETGGFLLYAGAVGLASLAVVQSISAGGIGVLGYVGARVHHRRLGPRHRSGAIVSVVGLAALGVSLLKANGGGGKGSLAGILAWIGGALLLAVAVLALRRTGRASAVAYGAAGGLLFSVGDFSTKIMTQGGARIAFAIPLVAGYALGSF